MLTKFVNVLTIPNSMLVGAVQYAPDAAFIDNVV
jgi:hypothetical protein